MRTRAPDLPVAPAASWRRSSKSTLRTPSRVRWKAVLVPLVMEAMAATAARPMVVLAVTADSAVIRLAQAARAVLEVTQGTLTAA